MAHVPFGLAASMLLLLAPLTTFGQPVPDSMSVEWQGQKPCEKLYEDAQILVGRCTFPPGSKHVKHFHPGLLSYVLSGGKARIEDAKGTRQVEPRTGGYTNSPPVAWHELTNIGDTTISYLLIERKYEPMPAVEKASNR
jgi:quercetin dioxygenase-like cupin family protein